MAQSKVCVRYKPYRLISLGIGIKRVILDTSGGWECTGSGSVGAVIEVPIPVDYWSGAG